MSADSQGPIEADLPAPGEPSTPARAPYASTPAYFERRQTRELLEVHIGLPAILEALEFAIADEPEFDEQDNALPPSKFRQMYEHMLNPSTSSLADPITGRVKYPIDTVMARYKVKLPELLALIGTRNLGMAIARSGDRLGRVIDGLGEAAEPREVPCTKCDGEGYLPGEDGEEAPECPKCAGAGAIRKFGDLKAAEMFIKLHGGQLGGGAGAGGIRDINLAVNAQASAKSNSAPPAKDAEPINVRIQKLIEQ